MKETKNSWEALVSTWERQPFNKALDSATIIDEIESYSNYISPIGNHFTYLFDCSVSQYIYISDACEAVSGFPKIEWMTQKEPSILERLVLPEDHPGVQELGKQSWEIYSKSPIEVRKQICCCVDYRAVHNTSKKVIRLLEFNRPLLVDEKGNMVINFGIVTDISHIKLDGPVGLKVWAEGYPEISVMKNASEVRSINPLTKMERQILKLISEGQTTSSVAEKLFISTHTVNTHRRNILKKMACANFLEAFHMARMKGWVD
jgi:DNA-binding CsgD family transcriptional regulator